MTSINRSAPPAVSTPSAASSPVPPTDLELSLAPLAPLIEGLQKLPPAAQEEALGLLENIINLPPAEQEARFAKLDALFANAQPPATPATRDSFETPAQPASKSALPSLAG